VYSTKQAALRVLPVRPSVRLSVCLPLRPFRAGSSKTKKARKNHNWRERSPDRSNWFNRSKHPQRWHTSRVNAYLALWRCEPA